MSKSKSVGVRGRRRRGRGLGIGGDGGGEGDNEGDMEYDNGWTGWRGPKVTMESMATDGLSGTATGLLGGPAPPPRGQSGFAWPGVSGRGGHLAAWPVRVEEGPRVLLEVRADSCCQASCDWKGGLYSWTRVWWWQARKANRCRGKPKWLSSSFLNEVPQTTLCEPEQVDPPSTKTTSPHLIYLFSKLDQCYTVFRFIVNFFLFVSSL